MHLRVRDRCLSWVACAWVCLVASLWPGVVVAQPQTLTFLTLIPPGSAWMRSFRRWGRQVQERSHGALQLRFTSTDLRQGEETVAQQLNEGSGGYEGAAMTAAGLSQFHRSAMLFQIPGMFHDSAAVEAALDVIRGRLEENLQRATRAPGRPPGYIVLAWVHLGPMLAFSTEREIRNHSHIAGSRVWGWPIDPVSQALHDAVGTPPVRLSLGAVPGGLRERRVDLVLGTPLWTLTFSWWPWVRYVTDLTISHVVGAIILRRDVFDALPETQRTLLRTSAREMERELRTEMLVRNDQALAAMSTRGLHIVHLSDAEREEWWRYLRRARRALVGNAPGAVVDCALVMDVVRGLRSPPGVERAWQRECEERPPLDRGDPAPPLRAPSR